MFIRGTGKKSSKKILHPQRREKKTNKNSKLHWCGKERTYILRRDI